MGHRFPIVILSAFLLLLPSCGFEPMYSGMGKTGSGGPDSGDVLAQVEIGNIPDREGQFLRNALIDRFYRRGRPSDPAYLLQIRPVRESLVDLDITKSADATRGQLRLETEMTLTDNAAEAVVLKRNLRAVTSYNILASEFATRVSESNARENALNDLARQIELQTVLYLKSH